MMTGPHVDQYPPRAIPDGQMQATVMPPLTQNHPSRTHHQAHGLHPQEQSSAPMVRPRVTPALRRTPAPGASRSASGTAMSAGDVLLLQMTAFKPQ